MYLIWVIARREFTENIFSLRLFIGLIVCFAFFVSSTYVLMEDYEKRLSAHNSAEIEHRNTLEEVKVYSYLRVDVAKPPEPLSVICLGMEQQLGSTVTVSYEDVPTEAKILGGGNPLLNVFSAVDAVLMVQIAFSLFVISIAYDVICGERESGTLALVASNPVSKYHILIGKYLGGMASLLVPLAIGWIAAAILINADPVMEFHIAEWSRFGGLFAASGLYLSVFFLLSMLISAITHRSASALVWLLFLWIVLVFIIPHGAVYVAKQVRPIPSKAVVNIEREAIKTAFNEKIRDYGAKHRSGSYFTSERSVISGIYPFAYHVLTASKEAMLWYLDGARFYIPQRIEYAEQIGNLYQGYYRLLKRQTVLAENLSRLSPAWVYYNAAAGLSGTDLRRHERFIHQAQDYRKALMAYMQEQGAFSSINGFTSVNINDMPSQAGLVESDEEAFFANITPKSWDDVEPLDLSGMPVFTSGTAWGNTALGGAFLDLVYLIFLIYRSPSPLGFIAEGHEKDLPNAFAVDAFELVGPQTILRRNYTLQRFDALDWVFIVGVILSFAAFAMTYDSISGEAEAGMLRLCLSNLLPRSTLLFGKYIGTIISLLTPLIIGICMNTLIISLFGIVPFESAYWLQIGGVVLFSGLYISVFATLGLFISCLTRSASVSLVLLLLVWVCFVVFIPRTGGLLASRLTELPDEKTIARQAGDAMHDIRKRYGEGRFSARWSPGEPLTRSAKIADAKQAIYDEYRMICEPFAVTTFSRIGSHPLRL